MACEDNPDLRNCFPDNAGFYISLLRTYRKIQFLECDRAGDDPGFISRGYGLHVIDCDQEWKRNSSTDDHFWFILHDSL